MRMVLVDTSVWVSYLRAGNAKLETLLKEGEVICHPFIIGELACGNIKNRVEVLSLLKLLPEAVEVKNEEVLDFIEANRLSGKGAGYIDIYLCASALLSDVSIWTLDKSLARITDSLKINYSGT